MSNRKMTVFKEGNIKNVYASKKDLTMKYMTGKHANRWDGELVDLDRT